MKFKIIMFMTMLLLGCSYSVYTTGYPHLKTIQILPVENLTDNYEMRDLVFSSLIEKYESDGRLKFVGMSPDCQMECSILDYSNKIVSYSGSTVDEYEVRVLFDLLFTDLKENKIIWENASLVVSERYSLADENSQFGTELEAQEEIVVKLFELIMKNTLEEW
ncbi:MAG: LPS assembly lipoprotein LptE [Candidatus Tenebribacter mawsonii]|nr:LPS assembly lipoprotein LptE [Candidatus Tenebribacter mawsonii]